MIYDLRFIYYTFTYLSSLFIPQLYYLIVDLLYIIDILNKEIARYINILF